MSRRKRTDAADATPPRPAGNRPEPKLEASTPVTGPPRGTIDQLSGRRLKGWAAASGTSETRLSLVALVDGTEVARTVADQFRADLLQSGVGDGQHAFSLLLPEHLFDGKRHAIDLLVLPPDGDGTTSLAGSGPRELPAGGSLECYLDGIFDGRIRGWAWDAESPDQPLRVKIMIDGRSIWSALADQARDDLRDAGIGSGVHGFETFLPVALMDGKAHQLELRFGEAPSSVIVIARTVVLELRSAESEPDLADLAELFDPAYYAAQGGAATNGLADYIAGGWMDRLNPHPLFDTEYYLQHHGQYLGGDPLTHFWTVGCQNDHVTHPLFDVQAYRRQRPDIASIGLHPLLHYLRYGWREGARVSSCFDEDYYEHQCPGIRTTFPPVVHYLQFGCNEGIRPHREFDPQLFRTHAKLHDQTEPYTHFIASLRNTNVPEPRAGRPAISFLLLNFNKPLLTLQCVYFLRRYTDLSDAEIIIVDNGSGAANFALLADLSRQSRLIRLGANRGFGEGNNIGAEDALGEFLVFLNNDCFVLPGWLDPLLAAMQDPSVGAAGPKFLYPDGRLQEAGAMIAPCGTALQRGKGLDGYTTLFDKQEPVDYISAAALMIRADLFRQVLGFDLCWDPAYYEDVDLCLKLRLLGRSTIYVPSSVVVHLENSTSSDQTLNLRLDKIVGTNRLKFVSRWANYLQSNPAGDEGELLAPPSPGPAPSGLPRLGLYTPFPLTPGGGERYLLSWADRLREHYSVTLVTPERFSKLRLQTMARALDLELGQLATATPGDLGHEPFDVFLSMGNQILPPVRPMGRRNYFLCQFPFPLEPGHYVHHWGNMKGYDGIIVYSEFAARHVERAGREHGIAMPPIHVVSPPVPQSDGTADRVPGRSVILNVGRFNPLGHCKRQDVMIASFVEMLAAGRTDAELHLAGSIGGESESRDYLASLQRAASGKPVHFHVNVSASSIAALYRKADIYWHLTGINDDVRFRPEAFEHFGITIVEAMSAGAVPIVLGYGGPPEIITTDQDGVLIYTRQELTAATASVLEDPIRLKRLSDRARLRARDFAPDEFRASVLALLNGRP